MKICKVQGCENSADYKNRGRKGYCCKHYEQLRIYDRILERTKYDKNEIIDCGDYCEICLYRYTPHAEEIARAKIDKKDLEKVKDYKWGLHGEGYVMSFKSNLFLHHLIIGEEENLIVDHKDHNKLNNRKSNLRPCTYQQNNRNRKAEGCWWNKENKKWRVKIGVNYKQIHLGYFIDKIDAVNVREQAKQKYFGEFAYNKSNI